MQVAQELSKIATILQEGRFSHKGTAYTLELEATELNPLNSNLHGKPLKKLTGTDSRGNVLIVWSHDVQVCTTPIDVATNLEYVETTTESYDGEAVWTKADEVGKFKIQNEPDWQGEIGSIEADEEPDPEPVVIPKRGRKKKQS